MKTTLITGAAGNLGNLLANHLKNRRLRLHLLIHQKDVSAGLKSLPNVRVFRADLGDPTSLIPALEGVDTVIHFAGVLFQHHPERFLHTTNTAYFNNLLSAASKQNVKRIILVSFPHTEGETTPDHPAVGRLDAVPTSVHAQTRLQEERALFDTCAQYNIEPVVLRLGMVYGDGILMMDTAKTFSRYGILGIWRKPVFIHLISKIDFLNATTAAIERDGIQGIYHLGDEGIQTLQEFLYTMTVHWKTRQPVRMPDWLIFMAAQIFEWASLLFHIRSPLTKDFVRIGMVSYYGDTTRMRKELLPKLTYRTYKDGLETC